MQLFRWQGWARNFGDELNTLLWPHLLPDFFDADGGQIFLGIGSVLDSRHPRAALKIVAGAGYGGYERPARLDGSWVIHWVRGPRTALRLGLPADCGLGDPGSLVTHDLVPRVAGIGAGQTAGTGAGQPGMTRAQIGFIPHFETAARGSWAQAAERADMRLIDPRGDVGAVLAAIAGCRLVVCEALHGAIVADALRVPWVAALPLARVHRAKWLDWGDALGLTLAFRPLAASSLGEHLQLRGLAPRPGRPQAGGSLPWSAAVAERFIDRAARALRHAAWSTPQLSGDADLARARARMMEAIGGIRAAPRTGRFHAPDGAAQRAGQQAA